MTQQLFEQWFRIADADKDGAVGGAEAVSFFTRSGLPQTVLGQIWEMSSGGAAKLNQFQFSSAMHLVALAQAHGGQLPLDQARAIVAGVVPSLPPPTLQGLQLPGVPAPMAPTAAIPPGVPGPVPGPRPVAVPSPGIPDAASRAAPGAPYSMQATGGGPIAVPPPYMAQVTGGAVPAPYAAQITGGGVPAAAVAAAGFGAPAGSPSLPATELQRFQATFAQLDVDRDGYLTGAECFNFFSQSGLAKPALRDIWTLVAGTEGRLSLPQFTAYLYLIDCVKRGLPLPPGLPPGLAGFPPVAATPPQPTQLPPAAAQVAPPVAAAPAPAGATSTTASGPTWSLQSQFGTSSNITAALSTPAVTPMAAMPPPPPAMPAKLELPSGGRLAVPAAPQPSQVPVVPASLLAGVSAMDRAKLQDEQQACEAKERTVRSAEERAAEAQARQAQLTSALQELVVFRNRTEVALLTSQDQARRLEDEVEATRRRYEAGYTAAQAASEKSAAVHAHIMELISQKTEMEEKMRRLEGEVAAAERMGPADVARLESELSELTSKCNALEAARNAKMAKVDGIRKAEEAARAQLAALQNADRDAAAEVESCQISLESLEEELKAARAAGSLSSVPSLLSRVAMVYRGLYGMAQRAGTAVPFEALPATLSGLHVWAEEVAAGVTDWPDDDVDARGFVIINALPGADAPRPIVKPAAATTTAATVQTPAPTKPVAAAPKDAPVMLPEDWHVALNATPPAASTRDEGSASASGFNNSPAFSDSPAFGLAAPPGIDNPSQVASAAGGPVHPASGASDVARPTADGTFAFAFRAPLAAAEGTGQAAAAPPMSPALEQMASFATAEVTDPAAAAADASAATEGSRGGNAGSGFNFSADGPVLGFDSPAAFPQPELAAPAASTAATEAPAAFDDDTFGAPSAAAAAANPPQANPAGGGFGFEVPAAFGATAQPAPAPALAAAAPKAGAFGDSLFGDSLFGAGGAAAAAAHAHSATAEAVAAEASAHVTSVPPPLAPPPGDSGALDDNPFAGRAPPVLGAVFSSSGGGAAEGGSGQYGGASSSGAGGFGFGFEDAAFGAAAAPFGAAEPAPAPGAAPLPAPAATESAAPAAAFGFGDDNPFGDSDNPFGPPAFTK